MAIRRDEWESFFSFLWDKISTTFFLIANTTVDFVGWVRHYGDPSYAPVKKQKKPKSCL